MQVNGSCFSRTCLPGMKSIAANCHGAKRTTPIASGFQKLCCNRPGSRQSSRITANSCGAFRRFTSWLARAKPRFCPPGAGSDITVARACCMPPRKKTVKQFAGKIPNDQQELMRLPGIGRYTSAAIASIAYGHPVALVDGNVRRVLQRLIGKPVADHQVWQIAERLLSHENPGSFNQALMELGALVCLPREPKCATCPVTALCVTRGPLLRIANKTRQKKRTISYALNRRSGSVFLVKRPKETSLMPGMWELPEAAGIGDANAPTFTLRHSITVTDYTVRVVRGSISDGFSGTWVKNGRVATLPLTGLARKILRAAKVI